MKAGEGVRAYNHHKGFRTEPERNAKERMIMALFRVTYFSNALAGQTDVCVVLPNDVPPMMSQMNPHYARPMKTLVLLHGFSGGPWDWITGSNIQELAGAYNLAVIMPNGRNSFYLDREPTGEAYATFVGEEVLEYARRSFGLSRKAEDTFIGGFSMGGFGALHTGMAFSHNYSKIAALSSALIIHQLRHMTPQDKNPIANLAYYRDIFGDLQTAHLRDCNPEVLIQKKLAAGEKLPGIFIACGTEDFLIEPNRAFAAFLKDHNVDFVYKESSGVHNWKFWNEYTEPAIRWMLDEV